MEQPHPHWQRAVSHVFALLFYTFSLLLTETTKSQNITITRRNKETKITWKYKIKSQRYLKGQPYWKRNLNLCGRTTLLKKKKCKRVISYKIDQKSLILANQRVKR